jgi:hypothetical protein
VNERGGRKTGGLTLAGKTRNARKETSPSPILLSTHSTRSSLGLITHLTGDGPATDRPKHDMVPAFFLPFL